MLRCGSTLRRALWISVLFISACFPREEYHSKNNESDSAARYAVHGTLQTAARAAVDSDVNDPLAPYISNDTPTQAQRIDNPVTVGGYLNLPARGSMGDSYSVGDVVDVFDADLHAGDTITLSVGDDPAVNDLDLLLVNERMEIIDGAFGVDTSETLTITDTQLNEKLYIAVVMCGSTLYNCDPLPANYVGASTYVLNLSPAAASSAAPAALQLSDDFVPGEIIAQFTATPNQSTAPRALARAMSGVRRASLQPKLLRLEAAATKSNIGTSGLRAAAPRLARGMVATDPQSKLDTIMAVKALRRRGDVGLADLNYTRAPLLAPNDTMYTYQWHYQLINLPQAWDVTTGSSTNGNDVIVAIIDTGILMNHPDLIDKVVAGYDFIADADNALDGDGMDNDANDPGDKSYGTRSSFHGTHVAGTIAAASDNALGVAGISWSAKLMPLRVLGKNGGTSYDVMQAVLYAAGLDNDSGTTPAQRADVINLSLGGGGYSNTEQDAFRRAHDAGVIIVAAAGNNGSTSLSYPAAYQGVVSVSAVDSKVNRAAYSNYGASIAVAAPGGSLQWDVNGDGQADGVMSTSGNDSSGTVAYTYTLLSGTSMAAPHVAGVAALMKAVKPELSADDFDTLLASGALTRDLGASGRDDDFGYGLIDAYQAVSAAADGNVPNNPTLVAYPAGLNFGATFTRLTLMIDNVGGGSLHAQAAAADASWITLDPQIDADGLGSYTVRVDRRGLANGVYHASIALSSDANSVTVPVTMTVDGNLTNASSTVYQWIVLVDAKSGDTVAATQAAPGMLGYEFRFDLIAPGDYYVVAGSDLDNDQFICDGGEACGAYAVNNNAAIITIVDRDVGDVSVHYTFDAQAQIPISSRDVASNAGITRTIVSR